MDFYLDAIKKMLGFPARGSTEDLKKVEPTKSLLVSSMPCEKKAAIIRNKTVDSMQTNDIGDVAYRFLQSRRGENNTFNEAMFWGSYSIAVFALTRRCPISHLPMRIAGVGVTALHVPPNISNTLRYRETKKSCENWLTDRLGKVDVEQIKLLKFNQAGMFKLTEFLKQAKVDTTTLEGREQKKDEWFSCWNMDR